MNTSTIEPIVKDEVVMIFVYFSNGNFKANQELVTVILQAAAYFGSSSVEDLRKVTEQDFFEVHTLVNDQYGLNSKVWFKSIVLKNWVNLSKPV